jgi:uncharacterized protein (TIGR02145 family)
MKIKLLTVLALCTVLSFSGCKEEPSQIPTVPTTLSLEDGAVVEELNVELSASGSTVEDNGFNVSYVYYIGKSEDALEKTKSEVELEPYTQYFWCAQAKTEAGEGEKTEVRTFYCVPPFSVATDNGDGMYAAVIKWDNGDKFKSVTVSATANHDGYELEPQTITDGADSCYFVRKRDASDPTKDNAFVQWWDDEHGVYAEPVVYDFTVEATAQVGDMAFTLKGNTKECILDKQHVVRDHEFNVYRVVTHGNQTWLADDLRSTSFINENGEVVKLEEGIDYIYSTLKSGATGVLYRLSYWGDFVGNAFDRSVEYGTLYDVWQSLEKIQFAPKGYDLPTDDDFLAIERSYGIADVPMEARRSLQPGIVNCIVNTLGVDNSYTWEQAQKTFEGDDSGIMLFMANPYDWENVTEIPGQGWFNAKPFGVCQFLEDLETTQGKGVCYQTKTNYKSDGEQYWVVRVFSNKRKGVSRAGCWSVNCGFISFRCIKK